MFDKIVIVDQSVSQTVPQLLSADRPRAFIPIFSPRGFGKDDEIKLFMANSQDSLTARYGKPNLLTTLAPMYYAYEFLRGGGDVYIRRITSKTSAYSHLVIAAKFRAGTGANVGKAEVVFEIQTLGTATNHDQMVADAEALLSTTPDSDGYTKYPIALMALNWSGLEGNKYTTRLLPNRVLDKQIDAKAYQVELRSGTTASPQTVSFTLDANTILDGQSIYADDIFDEQSQDVDFTVLATYTQFLTAVDSYLPTDEKTKPDIFFGVTKSGQAYPNYVILGTSVDFTATGGIGFNGGSDGTFASSVSNREDNMMSRLVESFGEEATQVLENEYKYFIDYVFDFGAPQSVKDAIVAFGQRRKTTKPVIDTGRTNRTVTAIVNDRTTGGLTYDTEKVVLVSGVGTYRDPFTNRKLVMPLSFFEASAIPSHIITFESGARPFAGSTYVYPNLMAGTYQPYIYDENGDSATSLQDNQLNFAMEDANGYQAFHQSTSLKSNSALGERNNVHLLHLMIRSCLLEAKAERWNFAEDSDIERYGERVNKRLSVEMEGKVGELALVATREGTFGEARNRVSIALTVRFKYINKGTTFTFTVV